MQAICENCVFSRCFTTPTSLYPGVNTLIDETLHIILLIYFLKLEFILLSVSEAGFKFLN